MREILLRSYDEELESFYYFFNGKYYSDIDLTCELEPTFHDMYFNWSNAEYFTGLLDKNENKIFEGDYLESAYGNTFLVDFRNGSFVLIHEPKCGAERDGSKEIPWDYLHEAINVYDLEIIGNEDGNK